MARGLRQATDSESDMAESNVNERAIVLDMLLENEAGKPSHVILDDTLYKYAYLEKRQRAFITRLFSGVIEKKLTLDYVIGKFSKVKVSKMKPVVRNCIRMAVYQILYMDRVPESAAVNESVKLVRKRGLSGLVPFTNGVLRHIAAGKSSIAYPDSTDDHESYMSVKCSMPLWLVRHFNLEYKDEADSIMNALLTERPLYIRTNTEKITPKELAGSLTAEGIHVEMSEILPYFMKLSGVDSIADLPQFADGLFTIQDVSSGLAVFLSGVKKGDTVIDLCAAPGGKTCDLAERAELVRAFDISEEKLSLIEDNTERLGIKNVDVSVNDAAVFRKDLTDSADVVFCDLPCSGLGIIARKPDIKYNAGEEKIAELAGLQRLILDNALKYVKPGGKLVFSTCTMTKAENEENFRYILSNEGIEADGFSDLLPDVFSDVEKREAAEGFLRLIPGRHDTDGFFISRVRRVL